MTQAFYGSYFHDVNSVKFNSYSREFIQGATGWNNLLRVTIDIEAKIIRPTMLQIFSALEVMKAAYSTGGQSFGFYDDSGNLLSWNLDNSACLGGVVVINPISHGDISGSHGVNFLKCNIKIQGDQTVALPYGQYYEFQETVSFSGRGQPILVKRQPAVGKPFKQQVSTNSWFTATQSGFLSTTQPSPDPMPPIWPQLFDGGEGDAQVSRPNPDTIRGVVVAHKVQWSYAFSSADQFFGLPHAY